ncbi:phosphate ABC transporter substrate-binding protein [Mesorhizobium hawassense]|uniref:Phosphate ABC transporter substrate-binding protein n=1 Tax=Mesorhizobium hawassense TaxID=1209954 RepID=A0A330HLI5_9HYPH|nr:PhnD/SsuA/transferrin family substrate-binding protein [Mesorhizobium hawassense]RAZ88810.1 phosphate ABC transporter substrate-binding protein [Mesorhizobium hawassense]
MSVANLIACSRMYNVTPAARACWDDLFFWLSGQAGVELKIISHPAPAPLSELWARPDMGAVFMCGYPLSLLAENERPTVLAAPVAHASWAGGRPCYASHIVVSKDGPVRTAADLPTAIWGWTVRDSQSGYNAPRDFLSGFLPERAPALRTVGPLLNPSGVVAALREGRIEVGAMDAYAYTLLSMHEPDAVVGLRIVATTRSLPCPTLVSSRTAPADMVSTLRQALLRAHESEDGRAALRPLAIERFDNPDVASYRVLAEAAEAVDQRLAAW